MTREEIIQEIKQYFNVKELVCNHTYARFGERAWQFLDTDYLHALLVIRRDILRVPMVCNFSTAMQRGLRCNCCQMVQSKSKLGQLYLSAHILGKAGDFTPKGMTAEIARRTIIANADLLPCPIRMEEGVSWLHFDVRPTHGSREKVTLFKG